MVVQTVLIPRSFGLRAAKQWLARNGYKFNKVDVKTNYYRFRQIDPTEGSSYYTTSLKDGIRIVHMN